MNRSRKGHRGTTGQNPPGVPLHNGTPVHPQGGPVHIPVYQANRGVPAPPDPEVPPTCPLSLAQREAAAPFFFDKREPEYRPIEPPLVLIAFTDRALEQAKALVGISANEVGWWGTVREIDTGKENVRCYLIEDMYLVEQTVEPGFNTLKGQGKSKLVMEWKNELGDMTKVMERYNRLWAWCHSHGNGDVNPSYVDNNQWNLMRSESKHPVSIRLIFNRLGEVRADIDLIPEKLRILDVQCIRMNLEPTPLELELRNRYDQIVNVRPVVNVQPQPYAPNNGNYGQAVDTAFGTVAVAGGYQHPFSPDEGAFHD